ncbi:MAG: hypothetical protein Q9196_006827 [Gyalolechia fulgens]
MFGKRKERGAAITHASGQDLELANYEPKESQHHQHKHHHPQFNHNGHKVTKGVLLETFLGGIVEIVLFMVLLRKNVDDPADIEHYNHLIPVIRAAILGSILANLLLCMGFCFFAGGIRREEQEFDGAISEVGSGLLMTAGFGLMIPAAFFTSLSGSTSVELSGPEELTDKVLKVSRVTAVTLFVAFLLYTWFQMRTHHSIYDAVLKTDDQRDEDRHKDLKKAKLTLTECVLALVIAITLVCLHAVFLVEEIEYIVEERGVSDAFMGLILVPLVEKAAEHLTAIDEAWDNQMNFALAHVLGATIQTALFNGPLVVIVGWGLHKAMDLNFEIFNAVILILAIIVAGNFLRDGKSNYLEGALCILIYIIIAVTSFYYPNPAPHSAGTSEASPGTGEAGAAAEGGQKLFLLR